MKTVIGLYDKRDDAGNAIQALVDAGFSRDRISLATQSGEGDDIDLQRSDTVKEYDSDETKRDMKRNRAAGNESGEGAAIGGTVGAVLGGIGGLLVGLGTLAIPGLGVIAAAGPLAGLLGGALAGGAAGGIVGALVGLGIPEEEAHVYAEGVRRGGTLVVLQTADDRVDEAQSIMERFHPVNVERRAENWREKGWEGGYELEGERRMGQEGLRSGTGMRDERHREEFGTAETDEYIERDIVEEELNVGKREVDRGGVRMRSHVTEEPVEKQVNLRREEIDVERVNVDRDLAPGEFDFTEDEEVIELHETEEEAVVEKKPRVTGQVRVSKATDTETETIRDTVRRKDVEVEGLQGEEGRFTQASGMGDMDEAIDRYMREHEQEFRRHYETELADTGRDYSYFRPAYMYGCKLAQADQFSALDWQEIEAEARRRWYEANDEASWYMVEDAVRTSYTSCRS